MENIEFCFLNEERLDPAAAANLDFVQGLQYCHDDAARKGNFMVEYEANMEQLARQYGLVM